MNFKNIDKGLDKKSLNVTFSGISSRKINLW